MVTLDPTDPEIWSLVKRTVGRARRSSFHCAIASVDTDGHPYVTPIGSLGLGEPGHGTYLDVYNVQLGRNLDHDPRVTVMAVDSSPALWLRGLVQGRFPHPPGVRLLGTAGAPRPATEEEMERFRRSVRPTLLTPGGRCLFGRFDAVNARDLTFTAVAPVRTGPLTQHLWRFDNRTGERAGSDQEPAPASAIRAGG